MKNLTGNLFPVTIDVWILRYFGQENETLTPKRYKALSDKISRIAIKHYIFPAELQAVLWSAARAQAGFKPATYLLSALDERQMTFDFFSIEIFYLTLILNCGILQKMN